LNPSHFKKLNPAVWQQAMTKELSALADNQTWSIIPLPAGKHAVGCRWIFKTKFNVDGTIERHKARLVAQGFLQKFEINYKEIFASNAKMTIVCVLLSVPVNQG
jgi:hypothetical protein